MCRVSTTLTITCARSNFFSLIAPEVDELIRKQAGHLRDKLLQCSEGLPLCMCGCECGQVGQVNQCSICQAMLLCKHKLSTCTPHPPPPTPHITPTHVWTHTHIRINVAELAAVGVLCVRPWHRSSNGLASCASHPTHSSCMPKSIPRLPFQNTTSGVCMYTRGGIKTALEPVLYE